MSDGPIEELKIQSAEGAKDPKTRMILIVLLVLWLVTLAVLVGVAWRAYFAEKSKIQSLAQHITMACETGDFGSDFSDEDQAALCGNAEKVLKNQGEIQDEEIQESEIQEPEIQNSEIQDAERQDSERQDPELQDDEIQEPEVADGEVQDEEVNDPDPDDPEKQDEEIQDPEEQENEIQDPEIDDPDPASPYNFTFVFTIPGNGLGQQDRTYSVSCNSGTGECVVSEV